MNIYTFDEIPVGLSCHFEKSISTDMETKFREISGDENPLHYDDAFARELKGFPSHVTFGMLTASLYSTLCGVYLPGKYSLIHSMELKFLRPVFVGDTLIIEGQVTGKQEGLRLLEIKGKITNQNGECVSKASIKVLVLKYKKKRSNQQ